MDLTIVREFTVLADTCNFQIASESLSMSQSALSKHIQKLEEELNMPLFDRSKRSVTLNENGKIFLEYARQFCKLFDECDHALLAQRSARDNSLYIGFMKIHDQYNLIEHLTDFNCKYPNIELNMLEQNGDQIRGKLTSGECDFVFAAEVSDFNEEEYNKIVYRTDRLVVLLPPGHRLAGRESLTIDDIRGERFIEHATPLEQRLFSTLCAEFDFRPNFAASISYSSTILRMISQGMGIGVISEGCTEQYESFNLSKAVLEPLTEFDIYIVYKRRRQSQAAKDFLAFFKNIEN